MKKKVITLLCVTIALGLVGCKNTSNNTSMGDEEVVSVPDEDVKLMFF